MPEGGGGWDIICPVLQMGTSTCSPISDQPEPDLSDTLGFTFLGDVLSVRN